MGFRSGRTLWRLPLTLAAALLLVMLISACGAPQETPAVETPTVAAPETVAVQPAASGAQDSVAGQPAAGKAQDGDSSTEGIQVHGDWVLEVRNPDGSVVERREFRNALTPYGAAALERALGRAGTIGLWNLQLGADPLSSSPWTDGGSSGGIGALFFEPDTMPFPTSYFFDNLTVSRPASGGMRLTGTAIAQRDGQITVVTSLATVCGPTETPASRCNSGAEGATWDVFSRRVLSTPVSLGAGQQVVASLTITFS